jgi:hypothetical protein
MSVNHRLSSREHLAEAAALHGEGALGPAVRCLRVAAVEAVAALDEPVVAARQARRRGSRAARPDERDGPGRGQRRVGAPGGSRHERGAAPRARGRLVPPGAAARLATRGIPPAGVRDLLAELYLDCAVQQRGDATEFTARQVEQAIGAVQQLADVATGVPTAVPVQVAAAPVRDACDTAPVDDAPALPAVPERPGGWLAAERRRRRRSRAIAVLVPLSTVAAVIGVGIVIAFARPERQSGHRLEVLSRTHELGPRTDPRHEVLQSP